MKRLCVLLLAALLFLRLIPDVCAVDFETASKSLSLTYRYVDADNTSHKAIPVKLYKIASADQNFRFTAAPFFVSFQRYLNQTNTDWTTLADQLVIHVAEHKLTTQDQTVTGDDGTAKFPSDATNPLTPGMYLLIADNHRYNGSIFYSLPVIITLPGIDPATGSLLSDIVVDAKYQKQDDQLISIQAEKKWDDKNYESKRPEEITIILTKDGLEYDKKKLNKDNSWKTAWKDLDPIHSWNVKEVSVPGYTVTQKTEKTGTVWKFIITNTYNSPGSGGSNGNKLPQTGQLTWPIPWLASSGMVLFAFGWWLFFGHRKDSHEK